MRGVVAAWVVSSVTLAGCAAPEPKQTTSVVFDGQSYTIDASVACTRQLDGKIVINVPGDRKSSFGGDHKSVRVVLEDANRLVVVAVGIRVDKGRGFNDVPDDMWATQVDNTYTINGRMPPDGVSPASHQFKIEVTCPTIGRQNVDLQPGLGAP